ncbi:MAG TPA: phosphatidylserine decarboxylase, partial [Victivallales bacterium]|nr:phosphatidylserine decarboxylase [Victivallales bacterium]
VFISAKLIQKGKIPQIRMHQRAILFMCRQEQFFFIDCDDPGIGLVCVMPTGMVEISSCIIDSKMKAGYHVDKGEELGYFQFGGSTHCIIFQKGVIKNFTQLEGDIKVGQKIAEAF